MKFVAILKSFFDKSSGKRTSIKSIGRRCGAILIEFAFAIPVLVSVLFLAVDAPRFYYMKYKVKNAVYMATSILQSGSVKNVTWNDLSQIFSAAFFNHFPGTSQYYADSKWAMGYTKIVHVYYVVGAADKKAEIKWAWKSKETAPNPKDEGSVFTTSQATSVVTFQPPGSDSSSIYKYLSLNKGETRIIIDAGFYLTNTANAKQNMGFLFLPVRPSNGTSYFNYVLIFTPKKGLFIDTVINDGQEFIRTR
jgi:Flp pilus assembly protein TadG